MFFFKRGGRLVLLLLIFIASAIFSHLPSPYSASIQMGRRIGGPSTGLGNLRQTTYVYSNKGEWHADSVYRGDYTIPAGDTVSCGTFNGKKLWWWAKFYASGENLKPGFFAPQGGTSPWVLINSNSAEQTGSSAYSWKGWNGDMESMSGLSADIPTWRDGSEGAYSFTHDDIGAMPFDISVKPAWDLSKEFPEIKQCWGVYVEKMQDADWNTALEMVLEGHEMFNHSMQHTSAADQWQWFYPGQIVPTHDPAIPEELRGLTVVGTWGDPSAAPEYPVKTNYVKVFESPLVAILATHYWTQNAPSSEAPGTELYDKGIYLTTVIEPQIYAKDSVEEITLQTGQKQYVKYTKRDSSGAGQNEGFIAATGATWFEASQLDDYGGQYWKPTNPAIIGDVPDYNASGQWAYKTGEVYKYNGEYWKVLKDGPYQAPGVDDGSYWEKTTFDPNNPVLSNEGSYVGSKWSSSTQYVTADKGAPGFVAKVWCVKKWEPEEYRLNIADANNLINENIYNRIETAGEYFKKGKVSEYYGYPFDAYSEVTHDSLEQNGFVGARGGAKSGRPIPGDFFHPYRIDFDAFYITKPEWDVTKEGGDFVYPNNPHVLLGANQMVDKIIEAKGYMIREFHAVADIADGQWYDNSLPSEQWPINSAAQGVGGWWGGITKNQLKAHYQYVQSKIDAKQITVYTVGEVTKYRLTANACTGASVAKSGDNYKLSVATSGDIVDKYKDEISVIVSLDVAVDSLGLRYLTIDPKWGESPRRRPRKMDTAGKVWSVSVNPFLGDLEIIPNGDWIGQDVVIADVGINKIKQTSMQSIATYIGLQNGKIAFNLPEGDYVAEIYNTLGRKVSSNSFSSKKGIVRVDSGLNKLSKGMFILHLKSSGKHVLPAQKLIVK